MHMQEVYLFGPSSPLAQISLPNISLPPVDSIFALRIVKGRASRELFKIRSGQYGNVIQQHKNVPRGTVMGCLVSVDEFLMNWDPNRSL